MKIIIKNADVYNSIIMQKYDIIILNKKIVKIAKDIKEDSDLIINAKGLAVFPGLVDMHCHLREPGFEYKEDIKSGTLAAVKGGFTSVACMPNTNPVIDNTALIKYIYDKAIKAGYAKVYPIACITKGQKGAELTEMGELKEAGAIALSDDGMSVENPLIMQNAMLYAKSHNILLISHCEDKQLADGGVVNEGYNAEVCGLKGIPRAAEEVMVAREIILAESLKTRVHIAHISTRGSVNLIRDAKRRGVLVTAETCPHYFCASDEYILNYDTNAKVNPPLRTEDDVKAIIEGLKDGTIDAIATDHAPHHTDDKNVEFNYAANGISGFETAFCLAYTKLVKAGFITFNNLLRLMSFNPSEILGLGSEEICEGAVADITIADLNAKYTIDSRKFLSKGKNTPFNGKEVYGKIMYTIVNGSIKIFDGEIYDR